MENGFPSPVAPAGACWAWSGATTRRRRPSSSRRRTRRPVAASTPRTRARRGARETQTPRCPSRCVVHAARVFLSILSELWRDSSRTDSRGRFGENSRRTATEPRRRGAGRDAERPLLVEARGPRREAAGAGMARGAVRVYRAPGRRVSVQLVRAAADERARVFLRGGARVLRRARGGVRGGKDVDLRRGLARPARGFIETAAGRGEGREPRGRVRRGGETRY